MAGKGSARRPTRLSQAELEKKWQETFGTPEAPDRPESTVNSQGSQKGLSS
jgi:hypothetical protein